MVNVNATFHTAVLAQSPTSRIRIYFINDAIDCTDDNDVQTNGTLLKWSNTDTDSSRRISIGGVTFSEYYTKDENWTIGNCVSNTVSLSLLNDDGGLDGFTYGRCKIYLDVKSGGTWYPCPMGVYNIKTPIKRRTKVVSVSGYDQMQLLDRYADEWWAGLDFESGITLENLILALCGEVGVKLRTGITILNGTHNYTSAPMQVSKTTFRELLAKMAAVAGANARFDRDGYLDLKWFTAEPVTYTSMFSADIAEYQVGALTGLEVRGSDIDIGTVIDGGNNDYTVTDNAFFYGDTVADITTIASPVATRIEAFPAFYPMSVSAQCDWSVEAGDIVGVTVGSDTYSLPIFQQTLTWNGGLVTGTMSANGSELRPVEREDAKVSLTQYKDRKALHELETALDILRSTIQDTDGNVSELQQTAENIIASVSSVNSTVQSIIDPSGAMWSFMNNLQSTVESNSTSTENQFNSIYRYIRFLNDGSIVLGSSDDQATKLKIMTDKMMFYSGSDDETDENNAMAYFTFEKFFDAVVKTNTFVQIGDRQWVRRDNGHITLWRV